MDAGRDGSSGLTATELTCGSCGAPSSSTGKFCTECGARLAHAIPSAQYKQVTVLFADVVRSMDIAATLDPERLREVMSALLERSAQVARRYGGGTVEYAGDGLMVIFGAPVALEDHAFRGCLAALAIQEEATALATEVQRRDGVALQLRVGLNSGQVIAGEIGAGTPRYAATGETVGFAHRMESVAPPGGVMLSEATAGLVERAVVLADPEWLRIKGSDNPVRAQRLLSIGPRDGVVGRTEASLIGRRPEMAILDTILERTGSRQGGVVNVVGSAGTGKSRLARESAALASRRGVQVVWGFCESHARDIPFHAITRLLRASSDVTGLDGQAARAKLRQQSPDADPQDLLMLDDLLGIADPDVPLPQADPEVRRRRLTTLINARALARNTPTLFIIEDAHWVDAVSESMLIDFLAVIPHTASMVLITSRPGYEGALLRMPGAQTIALAPLGDSDITTLVGELLGLDASVDQLAAVITERAAGNPFFAEEMVRELVQRGVLAGERGAYTCCTEIAELSVPATVQAAIGARIDRLSAPARRMLNAAAVVGARFEAELLAALGIDPMYDELLVAELIDQVRSTPSAEYTFRHPLIRAVAYESQLKSDRSRWHRRLASAIEERSPESLEENAALIAQHLEAAGEQHATFGWHMRAGAWSANRDLAAARVSWERARRIADAIVGQDPELMSMRIAPRTMLCATDWQAREVQETRSQFAELKDLCAATGDKVSLAIAMTGVATELLYAGRVREAAMLSSEQMALLESIDDPSHAMGLAPIAFCNWLGVLNFDEISRWSQLIVDLAAGDPVKGAGYGLGSPLAIGLAWRGGARWWRGHPGWREDLHDAVEMARHSNAETFSEAIAWTYGFAMQYGVLRADDTLVHRSEDAVRTAQGASSDRALGLAAYTLAVGLLSQDDAADRHRGLEWMMQARDVWSRKRVQFLIPVTDIWAAMEAVRCGDRDAAITEMRRAVDELREGYIFYRVWGTGVLVESLLERGSQGDLAEARELVDWLAALAADGSSVALDIMLLRLRALVAQAEGHDIAYRKLVAHYRATAESHGFDGHIAWATAMGDVS